MYCLNDDGQMLIKPALQLSALFENVLCLNENFYGDAPARSTELVTTQLIAEFGSSTNGSIDCLTFPGIFMNEDSEPEPPCPITCSPLLRSCC